MRIQTFNPWLRVELASYELLSEEALEQQIILSSKAQQEWKAKNFTERGLILKKVATLLRIKSPGLARLITEEMGKPISEASAEIEKCAWVCDYYAFHTPFFLKDKIVQTDASLSQFIYEPLGVLLGVMPWNFPFWQVFRMIAPALMAGNSVLLKHAPNTTGCNIAIQRILQEAGLEPSLFTALLISETQVKKVLEHPLVKALSFTGSTRTGKLLAGYAASNLKKSVLELGGNDPFIVFEDAPLHTSVINAVRSRTLNAGQSCIAAKRFLVHRSILHHFLSSLKEELALLRTGNPMLHATQMSVMARKDLCDTLEDQVNRSIEQGAFLYHGGTRKDLYFEPTILTQITPEMPAFREELFGPVFAVLPFESKEEALALANDSVYGLGASLWTQSTSNIEYFKHNLETGNVFVNAMVKSDPRLPFGGTKDSGYGRELSSHGIREFSQVKTFYQA